MSWSATMQSNILRITSGTGFSELWRFYSHDSDKVQATTACLDVSFQCPFVWGLMALQSGGKIEVVYNAVSVKSQSLATFLMKIFAWMSTFVKQGEECTAQHGDLWVSRGGKEKEPGL